jgi:putative thiamine transport system substrate-binding protein
MSSQKHPSHFAATRVVHQTKCGVILLCLLMVLSFAALSQVDTNTANTKQTSAAIDLNKTKQWQHILQEAQQQTVYFYAWGGDPQVNSYIQWVAKQVLERYQVKLVHVKLAQTSDAVSRVLAEKSAQNTTNGQVDMLWINGQNFANMAKNNLLEPSWVEQLPNFTLTNPTQNPAMTRDFGVPTQGMEAPWGRAALTFYHNSKYSPNPPMTLPELQTWSRQHPGRFTYAKPPDFLGLSFLKYALIVLNQSQDPQVFKLLYETPTTNSQQLLLKPLWQFLDNLHPYLWREGSYFVNDGASLRRLVGDNEILLSFTFTAPDIPAAVARYDLPVNIRSYAMLDGSLSNVHFVGIPFNAAHKSGAKVVVNYLMSIEAQAKKQQSAVWGDSTVLDLSILKTQQQNLFASSSQHLSALPVSNSPSLSEPHPAWVNLLTEEWLKRYGAH